MIADRKLVGSWTGEILIDRERRNRLFNRDSAYVLQDDMHISTLTVEEAIRFSAWTRMPQGTSEVDRETRVSYLLNIMNLEHVRSSIIGDAMNKGISGGEMKRLSIAVEISHFPTLISLDEPTSGLDSSVALEVMSSVRKLCDKNRVCISTIHQPSPQVFGLFDRVVLVCGGRLVYFGAASTVTTYFLGLGYSYDTEQNPSEFILDICGGAIRRAGREDRQSAFELEAHFRSSKFSTDAGPLKVALDVNVFRHQQKYERNHATNKLTQLRMLLARNAIARKRDKLAIRAGIVKNVVLGVLQGVMFYGQANISKPFFDSITGEIDGKVTNVTKLLYFLMMNLLMGNQQTIPILCSRNTLYRRELASYTYSVAPYWISILVSDIPMILLNHTIFISVAYMLCQFPLSLSYFAYFYFNLFVANVTSFYIAQYLATSTENAQLAFAIFPVTFMFLSVFAGFAIPVDKVPDGWIWAPYFSFARWIFEGLMVNEFDRYDEEGAAVLEQFAFQNYNKLDTFWIVFLTMGIVCILTYISLRPAKSKLQKIDKRYSVSNYDGSIGIELDSNNEFQSPLLTAERSSDLSALGDPRLQSKDFEVPWFNKPVVDAESSVGCKLTFLDLHYSVMVKVEGKKEKVQKNILRGVSGRAQPGEICALLGGNHSKTVCNIFTNFF